MIGPRSTVHRRQQVGIQKIVATSNKYFYYELQWTMNCRQQLVHGRQSTDDSKLVFKKIVATSNRYLYYELQWTMDCGPWTKIGY